VLASRDLGHLLGRWPAGRLRSVIDHDQSRRGMDDEVT
jgi:hypothetical protein